MQTTKPKDPTDPVEAEPRDLGFGTQVATGRGERLLERDGTFTVRKHGIGWRAYLSPYQSLLTMRWPEFIALVSAAFVLVHVFFGVLYASLGDEALTGPGGGFWRGFFFSVHTFTGVGYGHVAPMMWACEAIAAAEALLGLLALALMAGLVFARFSRPRANVVFSRRAVIAPYRDGLGLMVRVANRRRSQMLELSARMIISTVEERDGTMKRHFGPLKLERDHISLFPLSWTIVHPIDADSPLAGYTRERGEKHDTEVIVLLAGTDETSSQTVHARSSFKAPEIETGTRFADIFERDPAGNPRAIDVSRIHDTEPV